MMLCTPSMLTCPAGVSSAPYSGLDILSFGTELAAAKAAALEAVEKVRSAVTPQPHPLIVPPNVNNPGLHPSKYVYRYYSSKSVPTH